MWMHPKAVLTSSWIFFWKLYILQVSHLLPSATKFAKVMFLHGSVILSTGGCYPRMHCRWYPSMPCSRGEGMQQRGESAPGGGAWSRGVCSGRVCSGGDGDPPESRRLLLRTVCILLECILVSVLLGFIHTWDLFRANYCELFSVRTIVKNGYTIHYWTFQFIHKLTK